MWSQWRGCHGKMLHGRRWWRKWRLPRWKCSWNILLWNRCLGLANKPMIYALAWKMSVNMCSSVFPEKFTFFVPLFRLHKKQARCLYYQFICNIQNCILFLHLINYFMKDVFHFIMLIFLLFLLTVRGEEQCIRKEGYKPKKNTYIDIGEGSSATNIDLCEKECIKVNWDTSYPKKWWFWLFSLFRH